MANAGNQFRPPKQWALKDTETITSFERWKTNCLFHISLTNEFAIFLEGEWADKSVPNHGLQDDPADRLDRKTAAQKSIILDRMLALIAQFVPSLLQDDITTDATSLSWIWNRLRRYYSFSKSEVNFLKINVIRHEESERYETLFQRIIAHLKDNLLTVGSNLRHNGAVPADNERLSPTSERLAVYLWLRIIDNRLPSYVSREYAHDLQSMTLKDLQPRLAENMDCILQHLNTCEDIQVQYTRSRFPNRRSNNNNNNANNNSNANNNNRASNSNRPTPAPRKICILCRASGRPHMGHTANNCWFTSRQEKQQMIQTLLVEIDAEADAQFDTDGASAPDSIHYVAEYPPAITPDNANVALPNSMPVTSREENTCIRKVQSSTSPHFFGFCGHTPCKVLLDSGANSSLVLKAFLQLAGIDTKPTNHAALGANKSPIDLEGEVHFSIQFDNLTLSISALVVEKLDCDILAGVPFCEDHNVVIYLREKQFSIHTKTYPYGTKTTAVKNIFRVESLSLKSDADKIIMPGDFLEVTDKSLLGFEGEVSVEPHSDDVQQQWPLPIVSRAIQGRIRIPNLSCNPIQVARSQHIADIHKILIGPLKEEPISTPTVPTRKAISNVQKFHSSDILLDEHGQLSVNERQEFAKTNMDYDSVFDPKILSYNDRYGVVRSHVQIGPVLPPPRKGRIPMYDQSKLKILQEEADKLEKLGVLAAPGDIGIEHVTHVSPSFLIKKPGGPETGYRFVTAFNELAQYTRILPTASKTCDEVIRKLASFKYIIKCDLTKSFYQIKVTKQSIPLLGTITPFKGLRVYLVAAMGMPGSSEALEELISRAFGDFAYEGWFIYIHDDVNVCGNTVKQLHINWVRCLHRFWECDLRLSAPKTTICPKECIILGWIWRSGTLSCSPHKISPLSVIEPPKTATSMRSFLGAYKAISRCIPQYASLAAPLENSIKGLQGAQQITWTFDLKQAFATLQESLKNPRILTIPRPTDKLVMTVDASPLNDGISSTLFIKRVERRLIAGFFSVKLKQHQVSWMPCEHEALAIAGGINHFAPYIRENEQPMQVLSDSKPCVQAYQKLCKGFFSASARVSTFLSTLSTHNVTLQHLRGEHNTSSDFASRHPQSCSGSGCQICTFVNDLSDTVVNSVTVSDVISGKISMPYLNITAWKSVQHDCQTLRRAFAHLTQGTRPSKKAKNMKDLRRILLVASVDSQGLLVVKKSDPFVTERNLIIVPTAILPGLITAIHLYFTHPTKHQMTKLFSRYFYGINSEAVISNVVEACSTCNSLKKVPKEIFTQKANPSPTQPGSNFSADVMRRSKQKVLVTIDWYSGFTVGSIIPDESHTTLRSALLTDTSLFRVKPCTVWVDNAPGFRPLKDDAILQSHNIKLDFGRVKNPNKNSIADKCIQELELELLKTKPDTKSITSSELQEAILTLNQRIRGRGLSAKEILLQRDQNTGEQLNIDSHNFSLQQQQNRQRNHLPSAISKASKPVFATNCDVKVGDLVYLKMEGDKTQARDRYIVTGFVNGNVELQKLSGRLFASRKYEVPPTHIILVGDKNLDHSRQYEDNNLSHCESDSDSDSDTFTPYDQALPNLENAPNANEQADNPVIPDLVEEQPPLNPPQDQLQQHDRRRRQRRPPAWHADYEMGEE